VALYTKKRGPASTQEEERDAEEQDQEPAAKPNKRRKPAGNKRGEGKSQK
jgi:hypothetical protein